VLASCLSGATIPDLPKYPTSSSVTRQATAEEILAYARSVYIPLVTAANAVGISAALAAPRALMGALKAVAEGPLKGREEPDDAAAGWERRRAEAAHARGRQRRGGGMSGVEHRVAGLTRRAALACCGAVAVIGPQGCGSIQTYRYKLALEADVNGVIRRGFNVLEFGFGVSRRMANSGGSGEALSMDLGQGQRPLIALVRRRPQFDERHKLIRAPENAWGEIGVGPQSFAKLYGLRDVYLDQHTGEMVGFDKLLRQRGPRDYPASHLPDLVTFANIKDPLTVMEVDCENPGDALQCDFTWKRITLEITDEPLTTGIDKKLPWLDRIHKAGTRLDGEKYLSTSDTPASRIGGGAFKR
jgi:hypothetical protein